MINYEKWSTKREKVIVKGKEKLCQKIGKETITCSKSELLNALETSLQVHVTLHKHTASVYYFKIREGKSFKMMCRFT